MKLPRQIKEQKTEYMPDLRQKNRSFSAPVL